jgi:tRNA (cmo5U34)-methyltransferase
MARTIRAVPSSSTTAADYFGSMRESYDSLIRRAIPRYDEMLATLVEHLPRRATRILELGSGTGNLTVALARRFPGAALSFVDASAEMLTITAERLRETSAPFASRAAALPMRFETLGELRERFDLVVSSISMHHVERKEALYRDVFRLLAPGGAFHWSDQTRGATEEIHAQHWEEWLRYCRRPGNCSEDEIAGLLEHAAAHDHYVALPEHLDLLRRAGFEGVDCVWRHNMWVVVSAARR